MRSALVGFDPRLQPGPIQGPGCDLKDGPFGFVHGRLKVAPVQAKEREHGGMTNALVAIDEGMVLDEGEAQSRCLAREARIEVGSAEGLPRLGDGGLHRAEIADKRLLPALVHDEAVEKQHLSQAEVSH
jgi:hypothetical protein